MANLTMIKFHKYFYKTTVPVTHIWASTTIHRRTMGCQLRWPTLSEVILIDIYLQRLHAANNSFAPD